MPLRDEHGQGCHNMTRRILIVRAGFAGMWSALAAARFREQTSLADDAFEIVVVAPQPYLHRRPRLYERDPSTMQVDLRTIFDAVNVEYVQARSKTSTSTAIARQFWRWTVHNQP